MTAPLDATEVLTQDRLVAALVAADMRNNGRIEPDLDLTDEERRTMRISLINTSRAISDIAQSPLDLYHELPLRHQYEALDLFANVVHNPHRSALALGAQRPAPEITR